jgi:hypothetical protein
MLLYAKFVNLLLLRNEKRKLEGRAYYGLNFKLHNALLLAHEILNIQ